VRLPGRHVLLPFQEAHHLLGRGLLVIKFDQAFADLVVADQAEAQRELSDTGGVEVD
jgi:hypothetical protein